MATSVGFAPCPPVWDSLIPSGPHVVGDALADKLAVLKPRLAGRSGPSARVPGAAGQESKAGKETKGEEKRHDQEGDG